MSRQRRIVVFAVCHGNRGHVFADCAVPMTANRNKRQQTKTHSDITSSYFQLSNRGLPNPKCRIRSAMRNAIMGTNLKGDAKRDDAENSVWQRSRRSSPRLGKPTTWRRAAEYQPKYLRKGA